MIAAARADGYIDDAERARIMEKGEDFRSGRRRLRPSLQGNWPNPSISDVLVAAAQDGRAES
ncbi:DUF533 domain-containing protein [Brucella abortus]|nr:DUF533 domain-containing protein [Brucella abortus]